MNEQLAVYVSQAPGGAVLLRLGDEKRYLSPIAAEKIGHLLLGIAAAARKVNAAPRGKVRTVGEKNGNAVLTDNQRATAVQMRRDGATFVDIGKALGVSESAIRRLDHG